MGRKKRPDTRQKRMKYNESYQKQFVKRYVFKLNVRHAQELITAIESMDNRTAWFKERLQEECHS